MEYNTKELNELAMKIILHAGDCRALINDAVNATIEGKTDSEVDDLLKKAQEEITAAHRLQTEVIQNTVLNESQTFTMLFIHAQDTLMTINSELFSTTNSIKLHRAKK